MVFIKVVGLDEVIDAIHKLTPSEQSNAYRRAVRAGGKVFQAGLKDTARSMHGGGSNVPLSFQKVPAPKVTTRGGDSGRDIESRVRPSSPLFNIFEPGAGGHEISPGHGVLQGPAGGGAWDRVGRKRPDDFFSVNTVHHPGLKPRPMLEPTFNRRVPAAIEAVVDVLFTAAGW